RAAEEAAEPVADARTAPLGARAERVPRPGRNRKYPVGSPAGQAVGIGEMGSQDRGGIRVAIHPPQPLAAQEGFLTPFSPLGSLRDRRNILSHDLDRGLAENQYNIPSVPGFPWF